MIPHIHARAHHHRRRLEHLPTLQQFLKRRELGALEWSTLRPSSVRPLFDTSQLLAIALTRYEIDDAADGAHADEFRSASTQRHLDLRPPGDQVWIEGIGRSTLVEIPGFPAGCEGEPPFTFALDGFLLRRFDALSFELEMMGSVSLRSKADIDLPLFCKEGGRKTPSLVWHHSLELPVSGSNPGIWNTHWVFLMVRRLVMAMTERALV